jgi:hypothetical protein
MILCEECDDPYHVDCIEESPEPKETEWSCSKCIITCCRDAGFEEGNIRTFSKFQQYADDFKKCYFSADNISELVAETEFWKLVANPYKDVAVEYGADIHTGVYGSGFPCLKKDPSNPYSKHSWNLNNIPIDPGCILRNVKNDIPGMMIPWLYVGMVFSTFCWHAEDHFTYSINYLHFGETKTWYGIPSSEADAFENVMLKTCPGLFSNVPDLLFHITTLISPKTLTDNNVNVYSAHQRKGEFMITFPRAYHAGFNHGFNCAEAVNFALPGWLKYGSRCVDLYRQFCRPPVFSHEQLVLATSQSYNNVSFIMMVVDSLDLLISNEIKLRKLVQTFSDCEMKVDACGSFEDGEQCVICNQYCHLSSVHSSDQQIYCLEHFHQSLPPSQFVIHYSIFHLQSIHTDLEKRASLPLQWEKALNNILNSQPTICVLEEHLMSAKDFYHARKETLADIISKCKAMICICSELTTGKCPHSLIDFEKALDDSKLLFSFRDPEIDKLYNHYQQCLSIQLCINEGINKISPDIEIQKCFSKAESIGFMISPEIDKAYTIYLERSNWYKEIKNPRLEFNDIQMLKSKAINLSISESDSSFESLIQIENDCHSWIKSATLSLRNPYMHREVILKIITMFPNEKALLIQLQEVVNRSLAWERDVGGFNPEYSKLAPINLKPLFSFSRILELINSSVMVEQTLTLAFSQSVQPVLRFYDSIKQLNLPYSFEEAIKYAKDMKSDTNLCFCRESNRKCLVVKC